MFPLIIYSWAEKKGKTYASIKMGEAPRCLGEYKEGRQAGGQAGGHRRKARKMKKERLMEVEFERRKKGPEDGWE